MKPVGARRLLSGLLAGIFVAALLAGAMHVHRESARGLTDNCALCSLSHQAAAPAASKPEPRPVLVAELESPLLSLRIPVDPTPDRAPARAPPAA